jgi:hypothetical protein
MMHPSVLPTLLGSFSLCVGIIFISYALQVKYRPFVDPSLDLCHPAVAQSKLPAAGLVYVRFTTMSGILVAAPKGLKRGRQ